MNTERPNLRFVFFEDAGEHFLSQVEIPHETSGPKVLDEWEEMKRSRRKPLRALCIFLLLAKHRYESWRPKIPIRFDDKATREQIKKEGDLTWIYSLAVLFKDWQQETNQLARTSRTQSTAEALFCNELFFRAMPRRPVKSDLDSIGETYAEYSFKHLPLERLEFVTKSPGATKDFEKLDGERLAEFAEKLETYEVENRRRALHEGKGKSRDGWLPLVKKLVIETRERAALNSDGHRDSAITRVKLRASIILQSPISECLKLEGDVGKALQTRLANPEKGENWFLINVMPRYSDGIRDYLRSAVADHKVTIHWAFPSAAGKRCPAIMTQWKELAEGNGSREERLARYQLELQREKDDLEFLFGEAWGIDDEMRRKQLKFYESHVVHHFAAILFVPKYLHWDDEPTPRGIACYINPLPMQEMKLEDRCAIFLEGPSPMLRFYYFAIRGLFGSGIDHGHLKRFNLGARYRRLVRQDVNAAKKKKTPS